MVASSQVSLLMLTQRKADCELNISIASMDKMALTREQSNLSKEYYSRLQAKKISYYANGQYHKITPQYLMGSATNWPDTINAGNTMKSDRNMILTDYKGQVVLPGEYADKLKSVLGNGIMDAFGRGSTFSTNKIPEILTKICSNYTAEQYKTAIDGQNIEEYNYSQTNYNTKDGNETGSSQGTTSQNNIIMNIVSFYLPILKAAAVNGWTTEYNKEMQANEDYTSDAIVSGTFQLEHVNNNGDYTEDTSLTYFITSGAIQTRTDSSVRKEITAWYNAEKDRIAEKENYLDVYMSDLSTELEAIKTEIQSIQTFIDDGIQSVFDWGSG